MKRRIIIIGIVILLVIAGIVILGHNKKSPANTSPEASTTVEKLEENTSKEEIESDDKPSQESTEQTGMEIKDEEIEIEDDFQGGGM